MFFLHVFLFLFFFFNFQLFVSVFPFFFFVCLRERLIHFCVRFFVVVFFLFHNSLKRLLKTE